MPALTSTTPISSTLIFLLFIQLTKTLSTSTSTSVINPAILAATSNQPTTNTQDQASGSHDDLTAIPVIFSAAFGILAGLACLSASCWLALACCRRASQRNTWRRNNRAIAAPLTITNVTDATAPSLKEDQIIPIFMGETLSEALSAEELLILKNSTSLAAIKLKDRYARLISILEKPRCVITHEEMNPVSHSPELQFILAFQNNNTSEAMAITENLKTMVNGINAVEGQLSRLMGDLPGPRVTLENTQFFGINYLPQQGIFSCVLLENVKQECRVVISSLQQNSLSKPTSPLFFAHKEAKEEKGEIVSPHKILEVRSGFS